MGTVSVCTVPSPRTRRSLAWLPRWACSRNPKRPKISTTSAPDRRRSLGMLWRQLHRDDDRRVRRQPERLQILVGEMQLDRFAEVPGDLVERLSLSHHWNLKALGRIPRFFASPDHGFDRSLKHGTP